MDKYRWIVNFDKHEMIDKHEIPGYTPYWDKSGNIWKVHPLPLLTCSGNGRGGGDYNSSTGEEFVGSWAGNRIGIFENKPTGFSIIQPNFEE